MVVSITITGKDRAGIIARITQVIFDAGGNLEDASMTILEGEFAMIVLASISGETRYRKLQSRLVQTGKSLKLAVTIKEIRHRLRRGEKHVRGTIPYVISVFGKDRAGIVYRVSKLLAAQKLNITDLNSKIIGVGSKTVYSLVLEVDVPRRAKLVSRLARAFQSLQKKLKVKIVINPVDTLNP